MALKSWYGVFCVIFGCVFALTGVSVAQEPSFFYGNGAMRYAEAPGYFHYVFPCGVQDATSPASAGKPGQLTGVCWPVYAGRRLKADGTADTARPVAGVLLVTGLVVDFIANEKANAGVIPQLLPGEILFSYDDRQVVASMKVAQEARAGTYSFAFRGVCEGCKPGTPAIDGGKKAQLDMEYAEFARSLTDFPDVLKSVSERAAAVNVELELRNQPGADDVPEAMGLYSDLNRRLAPMCAEPARACVLQYSAYQGCKKGDLHAACGEAPACEASCALTRKEFEGLGTRFCQSKNAKGVVTMALAPDWSQAAERLRAQQAANRAARPLDTAAIARAAADRTQSQGAAGTNTTAPVSQLDFMGKPIPADGACTVESSYAMAMMTASMHGAGGMGILGQNASSAEIAAGVAEGNRVSQVAPVYPALAKAAHVSGTVVLDVLITEKGDVVDISVASGPPLLQSAAVDAVRQWKYRPYLLNGMPKKVKTKIYVNFNFGSGAGKSTAP